MRIICDSREQQWENVRDYFDRNGIPWVRSKLIVADYSLLNDMSVCIDRKDGLHEVAQNLIQDHARFRDECMRARDNGIRLIVLIEHGVHINNLEAVRGWVNPRLRTSPKAVTGGRLAAIMETMADRYGVGWAFCDKKTTGARIVELLRKGESRPWCCGDSSFEAQDIHGFPFLCCVRCGRPHHLLTAQEIERGI